MQVKVLDASWYLKTMNKDARAEFSARRIPGYQTERGTPQTDHSLGNGTG